MELVGTLKPWRPWPFAEFGCEQPASPGVIKGRRRGCTHTRVYIHAHITIKLIAQDNLINLPLLPNLQGRCVRSDQWMNGASSQSNLDVTSPGTQLLCDFYRSILSPWKKSVFPILPKWIHLTPKRSFLNPLHRLGLEATVLLWTINRNPVVFCTVTKSEKKYLIYLLSERLL